MRPGKLRLVVEMQTSGPLMRPKVSRGPPRHAAHDASTEIWQPAPLKLSRSDRPSIVSTRSPRETTVVDATMNVTTPTRRNRRTRSALTKSNTFPPNQEPIYARGRLNPGRHH